MRKRVEVYEETERESIQAELQKEQTSRVYKRLMVLKFRVIDGLGSREISKLLELDVRSVNRIMARYKAGGVEVIVGKRHRGEHRYMTVEEEEAFLAKFREAGKSGHVIEVTEIYQAYQEAVGHPVTRQAIYYLLKKHGWRKIMPRGRHPKKASDEAIDAYKKNHGNDPRTEKEAAETAGDVPGRGWVWADQQA